MKAILCGLVVLVAVLAVAPAVAGEDPDPEPSALATRGPILIVGDAGFTPANGVTGGSGTPSDPYVIAGWDIDTSTGHLLEVRNTRASLAIRDVYVHGGSEGIYLVNVSNVELTRVVSSLNGDAVRVERSSNLTVRDSNLTDCAYFGLSPKMTAVYLSASDHVTVSGNRVAGNCAGIDLEGATNVSVDGNTFDGSGVLIGGTTREHFLSHTFADDNVVNGKPLRVYHDVSGLTLDALDAGQVLLLNVTGARLANLTVAHTDVAVEAAYTHDLAVTSSCFDDNPAWGLAVVSSERVRISGNVFRRSWEGLALSSVLDADVENNTFLESATTLSVRGGTNVTVRGNDIVGNGFSGLRFADFRRSSIEGNRISNVTYAMDLDRSSNVTISGNAVHFLGGAGLDLATSRDNLVTLNYLASGTAIRMVGAGVNNNTLFHNELDGSAASASLEGAGPNTWDDGYPSGGNYWSWYAGADRCRGPAQDDCSGSDGIGDTPVALASGNADRYPLMAPWDAPPHAAFTVSPSSGTVDTTFTADAGMSSDARDASASLEVRWDWEADGFWDTPWSTGKTGEHRYPQPGTYTIRLEVRDSAGFLDLASQDLVVRSPITVALSATPSSGPAPLTVGFQSSISGAVEPVAYSWEFGDGGTSSLPSPSHTYTKPGTYTANLYVRDARGLEQNASLTIAVAIAPFQVSATASLLRGEAPLTVSFRSSIAGGLEPYSLGWSFGDGTTGGEANPSHTYTRAGDFSAVLVVRDVRGALETATLAIEVLEPLDASPGTNVTEANVSADIAFAAGATGGQAPYTYRWAFGDGAESTEANPVHAYRTPGNYTVILVLTDVEGRSVTCTFLITVTATSVPTTPNETGTVADPYVWLPLLLVVVALAAALVALWWRRHLR